MVRRIPLVQSPVPKKKKKKVYTVEEEKAQVPQVSLTSSSLEQRVMSCFLTLTTGNGDINYCNRLLNRVFSREPHFCVLRQRVKEGLVEITFHVFIVFGRYCVAAFFVHF